MKQQRKTDSPKRGRGRPPGSGAFKPTEEQRNSVTVMASLGIPEDQMVRAILNPATEKPIDPVTLRKNFREELDNGFIQANSKVAASLFKNATTSTETYPGGIPVAQLFWLKCRMRWQQNPERNPPPVQPPVQAAADTRETAKRMAFLLSAGAAAAAKQGQAKAAAPKPRKK